MIFFSLCAKYNEVIFYRWSEYVIDFSSHFWIISATVVEDSFGYLDAPVERISGADVPMPYAANLEKLAVPQVCNVASLLRSLSEAIVILRSLVKSTCLSV